MVMRLTKPGSTLLGQQNRYDNRGELVEADFASALDGSDPRGVAELRTYDAGGNVIIDNQYYSLGTRANQIYNPKTDPDSPDYIPGAGGVQGANIGGFLSTATITRYDAFGRVSAEQTFGHDQYWNGTGGDTTPGPIPDESATTYAGMTLQTSVLYQGPGGSSAYDAMGNIVFYQYRENSSRLDQYTVTYLKKEGYLESSTSGINVSNLPDVRPATDESYYNVRGERIAIAQHTEYGNGTVADTVRVFAYDGNGQIISRRDGTADGSTIDQGSSPGLKDQHYVYVNGQQVAHYDESTTVDVLSQVTAFSSSNGSGDYVVQEGDTLKSIAQAVYGNASLWYVVAQANALTGDADLAVGLSLSIPAVTTSKNDSTTFKPYNPSEIQGSTTPNLPVIAPPPPPPKHHCNVIATIVVIAVVIAASFVVGPLAEVALGSDLAGAAIGAAAGSAAGQLAGDALGVHQGFSFGEVLTAAATAAVTAGVGNYLSTGSVLTNATQATAEATAAGTTATISDVGFVGHAIEAASSYVTQDAVSKLVGQPAHFSWTGLLASSVATGAASEFGPTQQEVLAGVTATAFQVGTAALVQGVVQRGVSSALGDNHVQSWESIGENAVGSYVGAAVGNALDSTAFEQRQIALEGKVSNGINDTIDELNGKLEGPLNGTSSLAGINGDSYGKGYGTQFSAALNNPEAIQDRYGVVGSAPATSSAGAPGVMLPAGLIDPNGAPFLGFYDPGHGRTSDLRIYDGRADSLQPLSETNRNELDADFGGTQNQHVTGVIVRDDGIVGYGSGAIPYLPGAVVSAADTGQSWDPTALSGLDRAEASFERAAATASGLGVGLIKSLYKTGYNGVSAAAHLAVNGYGYIANAAGSTDVDNAKRAEAFVNGVSALGRNASNFAEDPYGAAGRALTGFGNEVADAWTRSTSSDDLFDRFVGGVDLGERLGDAGQALGGAAGLLKTGLSAGRLLADGATNLTLARATGLTATDLAAAGVMTVGDIGTSVLANVGNIVSTGATLVGDAVVTGLNATSWVIASGLNAVGDTVSGGLATAGGYVIDAFNGAVDAVGSVAGAIRNTSFEAVGDSWHVTTPSGNVYRLQSVVPLGQVNAGVPGGLRAPLVKLASSDPIDLQLKYKEGWSAAQRAEADAKVKILNEADTVVTAVKRSGTAASSRYRQGGGVVPPGYDIDHTVDLQLGGADNLSNMLPLDSSVNRSLGSQIQWQIRGLSPGTVVNRVTIGD